jgi:Ca2+-binding RTX toxin-like protein
MRAIRLVVAACATIGILPTAATASTVSVDPSRSTAVFRSGAGASDVTSVETSAANGPPPFTPASVFTDAAQPLTAGPGCLAGMPVWCQARNQDVRLGGGDDRFNGWSFGDTTVTGGEGNDDITANGIQTIASGGGGADTISVGSNGYSYAYGNAGADRIRSIPGGVETTLSGGQGDDLLFGERYGNNILDGGDGDDDLIVRSGPGTVNGDDGADTLLVIDVPPYTGPRTLSGGGGADTIVGGPLHVDAVSGGSGNDTIDVSGDQRTDPRGDTVECGAGRDTVYADDTDVIAKNCETRLAGPMPTSAAVEQALARLAEAFGLLGGS